MHERLAEINQPVPFLLAPQPAQTAMEERDGSESLVSKLDVMDDVLTEQEMLMMESEQPDFDFRLSMLPVWARKAAMSRPSVAQQASKGLQRVHSAESGMRTAEGKWAEVRIMVVAGQYAIIIVCVCIIPESGGVTTDICIRRQA